MSFRFRCAWLAAALFCGYGRAEDYAGLRQKVRELGRLTAAPKMYPGEGRALFFEGLPYRGKPTRVFAFYHAPDKRQGKVPGIVLVHGGGGTAYKEWVQKWNEHGFAAISIAVEGQTDQADPKTRWKQHAWAGPERDAIYADTAQPLAEQWMYHALADTILANSLIRSFPEVDASKVGIMGTSWGGVITSTVIGIDTRFAFAIPTYGCGSMADAENHWGKALHDNVMYREVWDPLQYLANARMPVLWFTWLHDIHFPLTSQSASYRAAGGPRMVAVLPNMKHSHPAAWNPPDSYAFAESVVRDGRPWLRQEWLRVGHLLRVSVGFSAARPIDSAVLISTTESGFTGSRKWVESAATVEQQGARVSVTAELPPGTRAWMINVRAGVLTGSSDFVE